MNYGYFSRKNVNYVKTNKHKHLSRDNVSKYEAYLEATVQQNKESLNAGTN
jgi:hypothetical protein